MYEWSNLAWETPDVDHHNILKGTSLWVWSPSLVLLGPGSLLGIPETFADTCLIQGAKEIETKKGVSLVVNPTTALSCLKSPVVL